MEASRLFQERGSTWITKLTKDKPSMTKTRLELTGYCENLSLCSFLQHRTSLSLSHAPEQENAIMNDDDDIPSGQQKHHEQQQRKCNCNGK